MRYTPTKYVEIAVPLKYLTLYPANYEIKRRKIYLWWF